MRAEDLCAWILEWIAQAQNLEPASISASRRFFDYGLDSLHATRLSAALSSLLNRAVSPTLLWEFQTVSALASYLVAPAAPARTSSASVQGVPGAPDEPIAVVGLACRFPKAAEPESFWQLLRRGVDAITEVPRERWDAAALYDADAMAAGRVSSKWGGFLEQIERFDPQFFGISPREAAQMDPQQRLMLELAWEALEAAGIPAPSLQDSRTGVFVGTLFHEYALLQDRGGLMPITAHTSTGGAGCMIANRISYVLGLTGPSLTVETACSSSLVAVHLACQSLRSREVSLALTGGVNLMLVPETTAGFSRLGAMSPDGRCKAFDASANGYVRGEGAGIVVLKRLSDALRSGDSIHCLIRGSAVGNDGLRNGLTAPSPKAQRLVLQEACRQAQVAPSSVHYVEAHGTGTALGDPIEAAALGAVYGAGRSPEQALRIGSVKTNLGHLEAAAGIAGLIKTALMLERGFVAPSLHYRQPNPLIDFAALGLQVATELAPWPAAADEIRRAGVSSFGYGGTGAHVLMESVPRLRLAASAREPSGEAAPRPVVWIFSGQGSQWAGMGRILLHEPVFRAAIADCERAMQPHIQFSLFDELLYGTMHSASDRLDVVWPVLFAFQVALAAVFRSVGMEPVAVLGHSVGEVAAAYVAGAVTLADAACIICQQGRLLQRTAGHGGMALVALGWEEAQALIAPHAGRLSCAVAASPAATVLSGTEAALRATLEVLRDRGTFFRLIHTSAAVHSPQMDPLVGELAPLLADIRPHQATIPIVSAMRGTWVRGEELDGAYWARQLRDPVPFAQAVACLLTGAEAPIFLELSPHPIVKQSVGECLRHHGASPGDVLASLVRGEEPGRALDAAMAELRRLGAVLSHEPVQEAALPPGAPLLLSGQTEAALRAQAGRWSSWLREHPEVPWADVVRTAAVRRTHHPARAAVTAAHPREAADALTALAEGRPHKAVTQFLARERGKLVFVFPGQGGQWPAMGQALLQESPAFAAAVADCDAALWPLLGWSVLSVLEGRGDPGAADLERADVIQPVLFAMSVGLAATWQVLGIAPAAVVGHSQGEVAAAYVAGALTLPEAALVIAVRSQLVRRLAGAGAMAVVELPVPQVTGWLRRWGESLSVAAVNGASSTVVSGDKESVHALIAALTEQEIFCRAVNVDYAAHSAQMDALLPELMEALRELRPRSARIPMYSTVTGAKLDGSELDGPYWGRNLRQVVRLDQALARLSADQHGVFVELSPHPVLTMALSGASPEGAVVGTLQRNQGGLAQVLRMLGGLHGHGYPVDWEHVLGGPGAELAPLPTYAFQRTRHWLEPAPQVRGADLPSPRPRGGTMPLLHRHMSGAEPSAPSYWEHDLSLAKYPYLADHQVGGMIILPGVVYLELSLEAAEDLYGAGPSRISDVRFLRPLLLSDSDEQTLKVTFAPIGPHVAAFRIHSRPTADAEGGWVLHATGRIERIGQTQRRPTSTPSPEAQMALLPGELAPQMFYARLSQIGVDYGRSFHGIRALRIGEQEAIAQVELPESVQGSPEHYWLHPALFDSALHPMFLPVVQADYRERRQSPFVFEALTELEVWERGGRRCWSHSSAPQGADAQGGRVSGNGRLISERGEVIAEFRGASVRLVDYDERKESGQVRDCLYEVAWPELAADPAGAPETGGTWLLFVPKEAVWPRSSVSLIGRRVVLVTPGAAFERKGDAQYSVRPQSEEDYQRLLTEVMKEEAEPPRGVLWLWGLAAGLAEPLRSSDLGAQAQGLCGDLLHLLRALEQRPEESPPRLWVVTRGSQRVRDDDCLPGIVQTVLWGLGRSIAAEHPTKWGGLLDLEPGADSARDGAALRWAASGAGGENQLAMRGGRRYVARLRRKTESESPPLRLFADRSYLITGGLGDLGLQVARWMVQRGAKHLVLLGRRGLPEPQQWGRIAPDSVVGRRIAAVAELEQSGATVQIVEADVGDEEALRRLLDQRERIMRLPIRGLVHAAGVIARCPLVSTEEGQIEQQLAPKVRGGWALHRTLGQTPLDFFVCFSSAASVLDSPMLGPYAAANSFLDGLCHYRRALGLAATSVNWGFFRSVGMAVRDLDSGEGGPKGMQTFSPEQGLEILARLLVAPSAQQIVLAINWTEWQSYHPEAARSPLLSEVREERREGTAGERRALTSASAGLLPEQLRQAAPGERRTQMVRYLRRTVCTLLQLPEEQLDETRTFGSMGLDSLMALELRNWLERGLEVKLSVTAMWNYPKLKALADFLLKQMGLGGDAAEDPAKVRAQPEAKPVVDEIARMTDEEAERLLAAQLDALTGAGSGQ